MSYRVPLFLAVACAGSIAWARPLHAQTVQTVFVIALENHNWAEAGNPYDPSNIFNNPNAPFINSIVNPAFNGGALVPQATLFGSASPIAISTQTAYASAYHGIHGQSIHPSEPNYIWSEAGTNFGVDNDAAPYDGTNQETNPHLTSLLHAAGQSWKSYQEDIDTDDAGNVLPMDQWYSPINNRSGNYFSVPNPYNGSTQYDYAAKHNPMIFFSDTNGGNDATHANPLWQNYAPMQQLQSDLTNNTVARYNWITPNEFNDMHSPLDGGYDPRDGSPHVDGGDAMIRQGDDFLSAIIPQIMASQAYKNNGAIILWNDETEGGDGPDHTLMEIVISSLAHPNVAGIPYTNTIDYDHSSDLRTMQEIFGVGPYVGAARDATDLADLFAPGAIPSLFDAGIPEPGTCCLLALGLTASRLKRRHDQRKKRSHRLDLSTVALRPHSI